MVSSYFLSFNYLLTDLFDLADAPMGLSLSEGVMSDGDAMVVDDDGE